MLDRLCCRKLLQSVAGRYALHIDEHSSWAGVWFGGFYADVLKINSAKVSGVDSAARQDSPKHTVFRISVFALRQFFGSFFDALPSWHFDINICKRNIFHRVIWNAVDEHSNHTNPSRLDIFDAHVAQFAGRFGLIPVSKCF